MTIKTVQMKLANGTKGSNPMVCLGILIETIHPTNKQKHIHPTQERHSSDVRPLPSLCSDRRTAPGFRARSSTCMAITAEFVRILSRCFSCESFLGAMLRSADLELWLKLATERCCFNQPKGKIQLGFNTMYPNGTVNGTNAYLRNPL